MRRESRQVQIRHEFFNNLLGLDESILAYRRVPAPGGGGKCNIHFAQDAVAKIQSFENCFALALDVSQFFESLDHLRLKDVWCRLMNVPRLSPDHFQVFKAITEYAVVDRVEAYTRLGHIGPKRKSASGETVNGYLTPYSKMPKQLCNGRQFQSVIAGGNATKSIIRKNYRPYGIPQGAPISDLLANIYLLDFDEAVRSAVQKVGGTYYRYSDDILIVAPGSGDEGLAMMALVRSLLPTFGEKLAIKEEKSLLFAFKKAGGGAQSFDRIHGSQCRNGLEYLGFRYDGRRVFLRNSTITNLRRKVARAARRDAIRCARLHPDKDATELQQVFNYERLSKEFGRVEKFFEHRQDFRNWTFWTYARRAAKIFGPAGQPILRQLRKHRQLVRHRSNIELQRAAILRDKMKGR